MTFNGTFCLLLFTTDCSLTGIENIYSTNIRIIVCEHVRFEVFSNRSFLEEQVVPFTPIAQFLHDDGACVVVLLVVVVLFVVVVRFVVVVVVVVVVVLLGLFGLPHFF